MSTPYTFEIRNHGTPSNFSGLVTDGNRIGMTGATGAGINTRDGNSVKSPVSVLSTSATTIQIPANAVSIFIHTDKNLNLSERSDFDSYFVIDATHGIVQIDVARMKYLYLKGASNTCAVDFYFKVV